MAEIDQGYKIAYWLIFFIMFIHIYFVIIFTESKIRLSSKFHSRKWKEEINGVIFDGILYLEEKELEENCTMGYEEYPLLTWPGTTEGVFLDEFTFDNPCELVDTERKGSIHNYKINSIYSPNIGNSEIYTEYRVDTPFSNRCYDKKINETFKCYCPNYLLKSEKYISLYGNDSKLYNGYGNNITLNNTNPERKITKILSLSPRNLLNDKGKKLCMKKVLNYSVTFNETCENNLTKCFGYMCIQNETECPNYSINFPLFQKEFSNLNKAFSSINIGFNGIECSFLNKNITPANESIISESRHPLSNFNSSFSKNAIQRAKCSFIKENLNNTEDIIHLSSITPKELYEKSLLIKEIENTIDNKIKPNNKYLYIDNYLNNSTDKIYLTATTYFDLNTTNKNCSQNILQEIQFINDTAGKISLINIGNIFIIELGFIIILCYILYKHFLLFSIKSQPQTKFYYVKFLVMFTFFFFLLNLLIYYANISYEDNIMKSLSYLSKILNYNCFKNKDYLNQLEKIQNRFNEFAIISYSLYHKLLWENFAVIVLSLLVTKLKVGIKELILMDKNDDIKTLIQK